MAENRRYLSEIMNTGADNDMETEDEEKARIYKEPMRRNLLDIFDETVPIEVTDERMNVFLRVRPFSTEELEKNENQGCIQVQSNYTVSANAPRDSHTFKFQLYGLNKAKHSFTFSRVFPEYTSQKAFFDSTMLKSVQDFIEGQNCLVFTYGVTNSGKTYTIQGNPHDAGVLPRGLDVLFNSINGKQWPGMDLKPNMFSDVVKLSPEDEEKERKIKERTLKLNSVEDHDVMTLLGDDASDQSVMNATGQSDSSNPDRKGSVDSQEALLADLENRDREETTVDVTIQGQICFSVWVSFAEIYNEQIFDLLEPLPKKKDAKRPVLKLSEDRRGSPYIKGLKEINVTSADEAYKLLTIGQRNLKTACTRLNQCSSRSHCIFNIKIIRVPAKGNPQMARVSMLSLCDLAGSERHSKTHTTGERLKEAGNINVSLLTLGRCIELLRHNQQHKDKEKIIPFRDSRLTRLFQNFFCGRGKAAMIVNVSQCASMFDETLNVFKFSAIAKQVVMPPKPVLEKAAEAKPKRKRTTTKGITRASSICWEAATPSRQSQLTKEAGPGEEDIAEESFEDDEYIELLEEKVEELEQKMKEMKRERLTREVEIRKEVCQEMQEQFVQIEDMYSTLLKETRQQEAERFEKKLQLIMDYSQPQPSKRPRLEEPSCSSSSASASKDVMVDSDDEWVSSLLLHQEKVKVQEKEASLVELRGRVTELEFQVADVNRKNKELTDRAVSAEGAKKGLEKERDARLVEVSSQVADLERQLAEITDKNKDLTKRLVNAEKAQKEIEKDCEEKVAKAVHLQEAATKEVVKKSEDLGHSVLLETLGQQLQEAKDRLKQQEKEIADLNEMLTDAGETFHQKENEIFKLKQVVAEEEEKAGQHVETIRELRTLLEESKAAVEQSEKQLDAKNRSIGNMKEELMQLEVRLKSEYKPSHVDDAVKKSEEELAIARNRLKHEEEDFRQREKALIHGYTAEINNLKSQMALLKSRNLVKCVATSPMRAATPEKAKSPIKCRRRKAAGGDGEKGRKRKGVDLEESFRVDPVQQLKELGQDRSLSLELRQKLVEVQQATDLLQQRAEGKFEVETRLEQTQLDLGELQKKFAELSSGSTELQRQLDKRKELHHELTDNQSESAELRQKLRIAESSIEDLEARLTAASQQRLAAEASKSEVVTELKDTQAKLKQTGLDNTEYESKLADLHTVIRSMDPVMEENKQLQEKIESLEKELEEHKKLTEEAKEKREELEIVVAELRSMLNQTAGDLQSRQEELNKCTKMAEESDQSASRNEDLLKTALSEANQAVQEKTLQCQNLQQQITENQTTIESLKTTVQLCGTRETELKATIDRKMEEFTRQTERLDSCIMELEKMKAETSQICASEVETVRVELSDKNSHIEKLQSEMKTLTESHQRKVQELEDNITRLQSSSSCQLQEREGMLEKLTARADAAEKSLQDNENLLTEVRASLDKAKSNAAVLEEQVETARKEKQTSDECNAKLQQEVSDTTQQLTSTQNELRDLTASHTAAETAIIEKEKAHTELQEELESKNRVLEELKENESAHLLKLQSFEKAQKDIKRMQDKKINEIKEALARKEAEVEELKASFTQLHEQSSQAGILETKMSDATMEIAELRSKLHMEKALTQKYKDNVEVVSEEKAELEQRVGSIAQELEKMQKEKANELEERSILKSKVSELEESKKDIAKKFEKELSEQRVSAETLMAELQAFKDNQQSLQLSDEKNQSDKLTLQKRLEELEADKEKWKQSFQEAQSELQAAKTALVDSEQSKSRLEGTIAASQVKNEQNTVTGRDQSEDVKYELETEKSKNRELQKRIKILSAVSSTTDPPGSSRRLRKEKIQVENDLINARFEMEKLQRQVEKLLNGKETTASSVQSASVTACSNCRNNRMKADANDTNSFKSLRQELAEKGRQLQESEIVRQQRECELLEVKTKLSNTDSELKEALKRLQPQHSQPEDASSVIHGKLEQGRGKGGQHKELPAGDTIVNNINMEKLEAELEQTRKPEKEGCSLAALKTDSMTKEGLQLHVETLTSQLDTMEQRLQRKKQRVAELQAELSHAQQQSKNAVEEVKANEGVIQQLKDAMVEQEETMEKQDAIISQKDEEMMSLTAELERLNDRCQSLLNQDSDSSRELRNLMRLHVRLEEEKKQVSKNYTTIADEKAKLMRDLSTANAQAEAATIKLTSVNDLKDSMAKEMKEMKEELKSFSDKCRQAETDKKDLERKLIQAFEEKRQTHNQLAEKEADMKNLQYTIDKDDKASSEKLAATEKELAKVKKAYEKDTQIYLQREEENKDLKQKVQTLERKIKELEDKFNEGEEEKRAWRETRDKMVGQLEKVLTKQSEENKSLKAQVQEEKTEYGKLLDQERTEKQELKRQLKILQRAKDSMLTDLRHSNHQLQVELALAQGQEPPPRPPPPQRDSFRVNETDLVDDVDTTGHLEVDATPEVAAKSLRKGRKRASTLSAQAGSKSRRKPRGKPQDVSMEIIQEIQETPEQGRLPRLKELEEKSTGSPLTRSAKKLLQLISPERNNKVQVDQENTPISKESGSRQDHRRHNEDIPPPPFDCAPFQPAGMEVRKSSRLRERQQTSKKQSVV